MNAPASVQALAGALYVVAEEETKARLLEKVVRLYERCLDDELAQPRPVSAFGEADPLANRIVNERAAELTSLPKAVAGLRSDLRALAEQQRESAARITELESCELGPAQLVPDLLRRVETLERFLRPRPESRLKGTAQSMLPIVATEDLSGLIDSQGLVAQVGGQHFLVPWEAIDAKRAEREAVADGYLEQLRAAIPLEPPTDCFRGVRP